MVEEDGCVRGWVCKDGHEVYQPEDGLGWGGQTAQFYLR